MEVGARAICTKVCPTPRLGHDPDVHEVRAMLALAVAVGLVGCGSSAPKEPPATAYVWSGDDPPATLPGRFVVEFAAHQVGRKYCWGGTGPDCFDCSGLVQRAWGTVGVRLPRTADAIAAELPGVPVRLARAGDILWWPGHVGLYAGGGWMIDAYDHRHGVVLRRVRSPHAAFRPQADLALDAER